MLAINKRALIVIKSTIPLGFDRIRKKYNTTNIVFTKFLREGRALHDNLYPSRIIVGNEHSKSHEFIKIMHDSALKKNTNVLSIPSRDAEAIKLFSNTYLAMRVSFFNELDSFAIVNNLNAKNIVEGVSLDNRIGDFYNNPSFGYGGYCLPKDTKQLLSDYKDTPQALISAIVDSNQSRKEFIAKQILKKNPKVVGIYRLIMKSDSENFRSSAIFDIMNILKNENIEIIVYEPLLDKKFDSFKIIKDLKEFKSSSDLIIANRLDENIKDIKGKVYTRDIFHTD